MVVSKFCQYLLDQTDKSKYIYYQDQQYEMPCPFQRVTQTIPSELKGLDINYQQYIKAHLYLIQTINYLYIFHQVTPDSPPSQDSLFSTIYQVKQIRYMIIEFLELFYLSQTRLQGKKDLVTQVQRKHGGFISDFLQQNRMTCS